MTLNIEMAEKVLNLIEEHPELHNQSHYDRGIELDFGHRCHTPACIAGWVLRLNKTPYDSVDPATGSRYTGEFASEVLGINGWDDIFLKNGQRRAPLFSSHIRDEEGYDMFNGELISDGRCLSQKDLDAYARETLRLLIEDAKSE